MNVFSFNKQFRFLFLLSITVFLWQGCSPTTKVIATWKDPAAPAYKSFVIVTMTDDISVRSEVESRMVARLVDQPGIRAVSSTSIFTHFDKKDTVNSQVARDKIIKDIQNSGYEAVMTFALVRKEESTRYVQGTTSYAPGYGYYGYYGPYYGYSYPYYSTPGYYTTDKTYYIETNIYDVKTMKLVWSSQSEIFNPSNLKTACNTFTWVTLNAMQKSKMIYKEPKK